MTVYTEQHLNYFNIFYFACMFLLCNVFIKHATNISHILDNVGAMKNVTYYVYVLVFLPVHLTK